MKLFFFLLCPFLFATTGYVDGGFKATEATFVRAHEKTQTTDAIQKLYFSHEIPSDGTTWLVTVTCHGIGNNIETFKKSMSITRTAGVASMNGNVLNMFAQPGNTYQVELDVSFASFRVFVQGAVGDTIDWECIEQLEIIE